MAGGGCCVLGNGLDDRQQDYRPSAPTNELAADINIYSDEEADYIGIYSLSAPPARLRGSENILRVQHFRRYDRVRYRRENTRSRCQSRRYRNMDHLR